MSESEIERLRQKEKRLRTDWERLCGGGRGREGEQIKGWGFLASVLCSLIEVMTQEMIHTYAYTTAYTHRHGAMKLPQTITQCFCKPPTAAQLHHSLPCFVLPSGMFPHSLCLIHSRLSPLSPCLSFLLIYGLLFFFFSFLLLPSITKFIYLLSAQPSAEPLPVNGLCAFVSRCMCVRTMAESLGLFCFQLKDITHEASSMIHCNMLLCISALVDMYVNSHL